MSKLADLKAKLGAPLANLREKLGKLPFLAKLREKKEQAATKGTSPTSLSAIYRTGSTFTRLEVLAVYLFGLVALVSTGLVAQRMAMRMHRSIDNAKFKQEMAHEFEDVQRKAIEHADVLSLGQFQANAYVGEGKEAAMSIDLWIRVSDPEAAAEAHDREAVMHDKVMSVLNDIFMSKVSLLSEQGKKEARERIRSGLNSAMQSGHKVEEVFIQNLVVE